MKIPLTFAELDAANEKRTNEWFPDGMGAWTLSDWFTELVGEVGEAGNEIKKLNRIRVGAKGMEDEGDVKARLGKELADVAICVSLLAIAAGIDLNIAIPKKFNATSDKFGLTIKLEERCLPSHAK